MDKTVRKKRSSLYRRPQNDSRSSSALIDYSSLSSTPSSEHASKASSDDSAGGGKKELYFNQCGSRSACSNISESETALMASHGDEELSESSEVYFKGGGELKDSIIEKWSNQGTSASNLGLPVRSSDGLGKERRVKKVKLKMGGLTHTIHRKPVSDATSMGQSSSTKSSQSLDAHGLGQRLILPNDSYGRNSPSLDKRTGLQGIPWKNFSRSGFSFRKKDFPGVGTLKKSISINQSFKSDLVHKDRPSLDRGFSDFDDEDDDEEIRYLEKRKMSRDASTFGGRSKRRRKMSMVSDSKLGGGYKGDVTNFGLPKSSKASKKSRSARASEDTDYEEEGDSATDAEPEGGRNRQRKDFAHLMWDSGREMVVTTRQKALQTGKTISSSYAASLIEFPNGLPPAPPRKQKEKLSDVQQQFKKAEAAERRRIQAEKAARESEAEAIRKILGQDSSRKKREDKVKKQQEELAQERTAKSMILPANTVRWVMGPMGTVVTFSNEMGLPDIFESKPCSYPPPREKCAGPSCTNPFKYRDSKSKLPLCSLQCYKAVNEKMPPLSAC